MNTLKSGAAAIAALGVISQEERKKIKARF